MEIDDWVSFHVATNIEEVYEALGLPMSLLEAIAQGEADVSYKDLDAIKNYVRDPETLLSGLKRKTKALQVSDPKMFAGTEIPEDTPTVKKGATKKVVEAFIESMRKQLDEFEEML